MKHIDLMHFKLHVDMEIKLIKPFTCFIVRDIEFQIIFQNIILQQTANPIFFVTSHTVYPKNCCQLALFVNELNLKNTQNTAQESNLNT